MDYNKSPMGIENESFDIITRELGDHYSEVTFESPVHEAIVKRCIHTAADFDYYKNLKLSQGVIDRIIQGLNEGLTIYTDTTMALSGINKRMSQALNCQVKCLIADEAVFALAKEKQMTRSMAAVDLAVKQDGKKLFVVGNAPTALFRLMEHYTHSQEDLVGVIGVPVGFVGAAESKEALHESDLPFITALGRKGGSNVAAALAAVHTLVTGMRLSQADLILPKGDKVKLNVDYEDVSTTEVTAYAIKDGGDDHDVTHGLKIRAHASLEETGQVTIKEGKGIGQVTKPCLSVAVGQAAINPVPMKMLTDHLSSYLEEVPGLLVTLEVEGGQEAALKTFNPKLGIVGGISIIGTTGIVSPMSEEAFKAALLVELKQSVVLGYKHLVFVFGNYGFHYAKSVGHPEETIIKTSNFIGFMLDEAKLLGVEHITLIGNIGKLVKVAGGIFHTHSAVSDAKKEIIVANLALLGSDHQVLNQVYGANTTEEAVVMLASDPLGPVLYQTLVDKAKDHMTTRLHGQVGIDVVMFSDKRLFLATTIKKEAQV